MDLLSLTESIGGAAQIGRLLVNERDRQKLATLQADLTDKLIQAQTQTSQVFAAIIEKDRLIQSLTERVRELESKESERARYRLAKLGVVGNFLAYELRPASELSERTDEPAHFVCQPCFEEGKKGILRTAGVWAQCPICKTRTQIDFAPGRPASGIHRSVGRDW